MQYFWHTAECPVQHGKPTKLGEAEAKIRLGKLLYVTAQHTLFLPMTCFELAEGSGILTC